LINQSSSQPGARPGTGFMLKRNDILVSGFDVWKVIDVQPDYIVALLQSNIDGNVDQEEDNIGEFILRSDILEN